MKEDDPIITMYCESCDKLFHIRKSRYTLTCPIAPKGDPHILTVRFCIRCKHRWYPRNAEVVGRYCPKCKSPYWNRDRKRIKVTDRDKTRE